MGVANRRRGATGEDGVAGPFKVLLLDDNALTRQLAGDLLEAEGFDAETVEDAAGLQKALEWWNPDVIVVDLNLPGRSGADIIRELRAAAPDGPPAVLMSATAEGPLAALAEGCGAAASFSTLAGLSGLLEVVREILVPGGRESSPGW